MKKGILLKRTLLRRESEIFLLLIVTTVILCYSRLNNPMQALDRPISGNKKIFTPSENIDVFSSMKSKIFHSSSIEEELIFIDGNENFISQATTEGWPGDGSELNPYVIDGLVIAGNGDLISISNTDLHFQIRNCLLTNGWVGIFLNNVNNGYIFNNTIYGNGLYGILLYTCNNVTLFNNSVHNQFKTGIVLFQYSSNNNITGNSINNNSKYGLVLVNSSDNFISDNYVYYNNFNGIGLGHSSNNTIFNNTAYNNGWAGIGFNVSCNYNNISFNDIYDNGFGGITIFSSANNTIANNSILRNGIHGIWLFSSKKTTISRNTIKFNTEYGILLNSSANNNYITWNNFISNRGGLRQASDDGSKNVFVFNHWDDWTNPDANTDGIIDNPYPIDGGNQDLYPLTSQNPMTVDILTEPTLLTPNGGEIYTWTEGIQWLPAIDSLEHEVVYTINISVNNGVNWEILASGLNSTSYFWNTSTVADGSTYLIKVIVHCSEGETANDTSDAIFYVHNYLSSPKILSPNGGEILNGTIPVQWSASSDSAGHNVIYAVYYSSDNGNIWNLLISGLDSINYDWDTTALTEGSNFTIKVVATCTEGLTAEDVSDGPFMVHYLTTPVILSSFEGDTLKGIVTIQWSASTDSLDQNVTYSIYYSPDNGSTWIPVASGLTTTSYAWNTTNVSDGTNYKIKIAATSPDGLTSENILEEVFSVHNAPPPQPDFSFLILGLAFILIIPELYFGRRLSIALSRKSEEGVGHT